MPNTLILIDRRDYPIKKVTAVVEWSGGGRDHVWVDDSGHGQFSGSGTVTVVQIPGETLKCYQSVNGSTTVVARSDRSH